MKCSGEEQILNYFLRYKKYVLKSRGVRMMGGEYVKGDTTVGINLNIDFSIHFHADH